MVQPVNASMIIMMLYTTFLLIKTLSNPYLCHISHAANAWSSSISRPFLTTAPCASSNIPYELLTPNHRANGLESVAHKEY